MIYYGLDTADLKVQMLNFAFNTPSDILILNDREMEDCELYDPFVQCVEKELLYLKYLKADQNQND